MDNPSIHDITNLLVAWNKGEAAALEQLTPLVHGELNRLAAPSEPNALFDA